MVVTTHTFPNELWEKVFFKLDYGTLKSLQSTCTIFRDILQNIQPESTSQLAKILFREDTDVLTAATPDDPRYGNFGPPVALNPSWKKICQQVGVQTCYYRAKNIYSDDPPLSGICVMVPFGELVRFADALIDLLSLLPDTIRQENATSPPHLALGVAVEIDFQHYTSIRQVEYTRREGHHGGIKVIQVVKGCLENVHNSLSPVFSFRPQLFDEFQTSGGGISKDELRTKLDAIKSLIDGLPE